MCVQLADLSATTALVVARAALELVLTACLAPETATTAEGTPTEGSGGGSGGGLAQRLQCAPHCARAIDFAAQLVSHPALKVCT